MMKGKRSKQEVQETATLIANFTDQSLEKRLTAAKKIPFIAETLGPERVKNQLIPFLRKEVINDDASVVMEMFSSIMLLGEAMGGGMALINLFPLLEDGLEYQQDKVRQMITNKYFDIVNICDLQKCQNSIMQSLRRLLANQYDGVKDAFCCVTARKLGLFALPNQQELLSAYASLADDPTPARRRSAAKYSKDLIAWLSTSEASVLKIIESLAKDKEQSNKIYLIDAIIQLAKVKAPSALQSYFNLISYQFTWRVRYQLISKIELLAAAMGRQNFKTFLTYYIKYLNDIEPEIRSIANSKLSTVLPFLQIEDIMGRIMPALKNIPQDPQPYVRNALASSLFHLCPIVGKKNTIQAILPKFLMLLKDEQEPQVKQTAFKNVHLICQTLGIDTLSQSVMPILQQMIANQNWRTRSEAITILTYLLKNSPIAFLTQKLIKTIVDFLKDRAYAIRKQGSQLIYQIIEQHGLPWTEKQILIKWLPMFKSSTFIHRETALMALDLFAPRLSQQYMSKQVFGSVFQLVKDPVSNVRMRVCVSLGVLYRYLPKQKDGIIKMLNSLREDEDQDVKDMANKVFSQL